MYRPFQRVLFAAWRLLTSERAPFAAWLLFSRAFVTFVHDYAYRRTGGVPERSASAEPSVSIRLRRALRATGQMAPFKPMARRLRRIVPDWLR